MDGVWNTLKGCWRATWRRTVSGNVFPPRPHLTTTRLTLNAPDPGRLRRLRRPVPGCPAQTAGGATTTGRSPAPIPRRSGSCRRRRRTTPPGGSWALRCGSEPVHRGGGVHPLRRPRHGGAGLPHRCRLCRSRLRHRGLCRRSGGGLKGWDLRRVTAKMLPGESSLPAYAGRLYGPLPVRTRRTSILRNVYKMRMICIWIFYQNEKKKIYN